MAVATSSQAVPRPAGLKPNPATAEAGLWSLSDQAEVDVRRAGDLNRDPALNAYVRKVVCRVANEYCDELRVYVLDRPFLQAMMAPNGYTEVWSGLLLRCEDEDQLAFVLGHEATHFAENHSIERLQTLKTRQNLTMVLTVGVGVAGTAAAGNATTYQNAKSIIDATNNLINAIYLGNIAAYFAFNRDNETEADLEGAKRAINAHYRSHAGVEVWQNSMDENAASDFDRVRKKPARVGIFDSHPLDSDRLNVLAKLAKTMPATDAASDKRGYRAAIRPFLLDWLKDDLRRKDFGQTLFLLDRLAAQGEDLGVINFVRGEAYRLRRQTDDLAKAKAAYAEAAKFPDAPAATWRELGDLRQRDQEYSGAKTAFETYLAKAASADDVWLVQDSLKSVSSKVQ